MRLNSESIRNHPRTVRPARRRRRRLRHGPLEGSGRRLRARRVDARPRQHRPARNRPRRQNRLRRLPPDQLHYGRPRGNGWSKACSCARRRTARVGRPAPAASLSTGSADDWTNGSEPRPSTPTPATRGRPGWRTSPNATSCGSGRRTSWRRSSRTTTGTSREEGTAAWSSIRARTSSPNPTWNGGGTAVGRRPRTHGPRGHGSARRPARIRRDHADTLNGNL